MSQSGTMATGDPQVPICTVFIVTAITLTAGSEDMKSIYVMCVSISSLTHHINCQIGTTKSLFIVFIVIPVSQR